MTFYKKILYFCLFLSLIACTQQQSAMIEYKTPMRLVNKNSVSKPIVIENEYGEKLQKSYRDDNFVDEDLEEYNRRYAAVKVEEIKQREKLFKLKSEDTTKQASKNKIASEKIDDKLSNGIYASSENLLNKKDASQSTNKIITSNKKTSEYIVKPNDTVFSISRKFSLDHSDIIKNNNLQAPYNIKVGQKLKIHNDAMLVKEEKFSKGDKLIALQPEISKTPLNSNNKLVNKKENRFIWPVNGKVISKFGAKENGIYNDGLNIAAESGTAVKSVDDGEVVYSGTKLKGYGNLLIVKHNNNYLTAYAHLADIVVKKGEKVKKGTKIGTVGNTGYVTKPQLHFGIRKGKEPIDPKEFLNY